MPRIAFRPLVLITVLGIMAVIVGAQAPDPQQQDQEIAREVVRKVEHKHMARPVIDDAIAVRWCDQFLKDLDLYKYFFLKGDIEEFRKEATQLDDQIRQGDIGFARKVFARFLQRQDERYRQSVELLKGKFDFTKDEYLADDPEKIAHPANEAEAADRWRKRVKRDYLVMRVADELSDEEVVRKLTVRYRDMNRMWHQFDDEDLLQAYLTSLTQTFDPHSAYLGPRDLEDMLNQQLHLSLEGIGASLGSEDGYAVVREVVPGMAADKDGRLQPDDKIVGIQKENGEEIDLVGKKLADVVRFIRGKAGTKVRLIVEPAETKTRRIYEITRAKIELKDQHAKSKVLEAKVEDGKTYKIGLINLPAFYGDTAAQMKGDPNAVSATGDCRRFLQQFREEKVDAVVMDLRDDGGGLLEEAKTLSGLFIDTGPVVQVKDRFGVKDLEDDDEGTAWDGPLVVLINKASASASEIFAGVIKDYDRGLIIGDQSTFGKGTVQSIEPIQVRARRDDPRGGIRGALKLTIQQFFRANGESTQINGVTPHIHLPSLNDHRDFGEGKMDFAIKFDTVDPLPHDDYHRTPPELVAQLDKRSSARRKDDPKFQKLDREIQKYLERKARHSISLNEAKFRAEFIAEDPEEKAAEEKAKQERKKKKYVEREIWANDFYEQEIMRIVADYLSLGSKALAAAPERARFAGK